MSAYWRSGQDHPFIVLSERLPDSHSPSTSPFFVRTIESAIGSATEDSFSSPNPLNAREIHKRDAGLDASITGIVVPLLLGVVQISFQAQGNHIAAASLQLAQAVATSGQAHRVVDAVGAGGMTAAGVVGSAASGIALVGANTVVNGISALQQQANGACRWALSIPSLSNHLATLNPFNRSRSPHTDTQNTDDVEEPLTDRDVRRLPDGTLELFRNLEDGTTSSIMTNNESHFPNINTWAHNDLGRRASELAEGMFAVGSDYSEDDVDTLDGIQIEGNPWVAEIGMQVRDNFQEIII